MAETAAEKDDLALDMRLTVEESHPTSATTASPDAIPGGGSVNSSDSLEMRVSNGHSEDNLPNPCSPNGACDSPSRRNDDDEEERKSWARRAVGQMTVGGVRHSMLTLTSTALGGGLLAVSYVMKTCGLGLGLAMLVIGAILAYLSTIALMRISHETGHYTYAGLFSYCAGPRGGPILDAMLFIYGNGSCVGYFVFLGDFIPALAKLIAPDAPEWISSNYRWLAIAASALVISPMALARDTAALRHLTPISILSLMYVSLVIAIRSPYKYHENHGKTDYGDFKTFNLNMEVFSAFAICIFAYNCHINVVPVAEKMVRPTKARIQKVSWRVNALQVCFYSLIGITGYLTFLEKTPQDVLEGFDPKDIYMAIGRVFLTFTMLVAIPMNLNPSVKSGLQFIDYFRTSEDRLLEASPTGSPSISPRASPRISPTGSYGLTGAPPPERAPMIRITLSLACLAVQAAIAVQVPGIADVIGLLGATVATAMMLVIPAYAMHKVMSHSWKNRIQQVVMLIFALLSVISVPIKVLTMAKVIDLSQAAAPLHSEQASSPHDQLYSVISYIPAAMSTSR